jgi:hypothetical protein
MVCELDSEDKDGGCIMYQFIVRRTFDLWAIRYTFGVLQVFR